MPAPLLHCGALMILWTLTFISLLFGLRELKPLWKKLFDFISQNRMILDLRRATHHLHFLQEMLESGLVPEKKEWDLILEFPKPWGETLYPSLKELREQGAPVLPSLHRMKKTLEEQVELLLEAKAKSSPAFGQAILGMVLIPLFSIILYFLMPGMESSSSEFLLLTLFALLLSSISFIWMMSLVDQARFGGLQSENRKWLMSVNATLERVLAQMVSGMPPDLAWRNTIEELATRDQTLAHAWKAQVWDPDFSKVKGSGSECEQLILNLGIEVRRSIQTSLIEGRGCLDRIESIHRAFLVDLKSKISRELGLLPQRCLKPLFIFVLPACFILMAGSFFISLKEFLG